MTQFFLVLSQHSSLATKKQLKIEECLTIKSTIFANENNFLFFKLKFNDLYKP